ncbi:hypothetical protein [Aeromonas sanarellii]|nr:hypothetical protein [Aeromonas sanarellii]
MSSQLKRMTFSIFMDPGALESDRYAAGILQSWYQRARKIQDDVEEFDFSKSRFHKDIYLSGMFLYVLAPSLCKGMANAFGPEQVNLATLRHVFAGCGFDLGEGAIPAMTDTLIDEIVARLAPRLEQGDSASLVEEIVQRLGQSQGGLSQAGLVDEIVSRIGEQQPAGLWDELKQGLPAPLDHDLLAEAIAGRLPSAAAELDLAPLAGSIQQLSRQLEEQSRLIREQHLLIQRLASQPGRQVGGNEPGAEPLIEDLSSQVASMKRVKAKGIF